MNVFVSNVTVFTDISVTFRYDLHDFFFLKKLLMAGT